MRATADSWQRTPFVDGHSIPYEAHFSADEFERLQDGLIPRAMEDKWFVFYEAPHLFFHRSWTGHPVFRVTLFAGGDGAKVTETLLVSDAPFDASYNVRLIDFLVSNLLLGMAKPFPLPEGHAEPAKGVFQHHIAGTGYPQSKDSASAITDFDDGKGARRSGLAEVASAARGRMLLLLILVTQCAISASIGLTQILAGTRGPAVPLTRFGLTLLLAYFVFRGSYPARIIFSLLVGAAALLWLYNALAIALPQFGIDAAVKFALLGGYCALSAWAIFGSAPIQAYWRSLKS